MRRALAGCAALALAACAVHPLGDGWDELGPDARVERAVAALEELVASTTTATGEPVAERRVLACTAEGIVWEDEAGRRSRLWWADIDDVTQVDAPDLPHDPVSLQVYVRRGSRSASQVQELTVPVLASIGAARPYLQLRLRPKGSRARFLAALGAIEERPRGAAAPVASASAPAPAAPAPAEPAPAVAAEPEPAAAAAPVSSPATTEARLEEVELKLKKLRAWREQGLISPEEYEARRRALLDGAGL